MAGVVNRDFWTCGLFSEIGGGLERKLRFGIWMLSLEVRIALAGLRDVKLEVQISQQAQHFVDLEVQILWQVPYFEDLEG